MNVVKKEFRFGLKAFLFWSLGLAFLMVAGMTKYTGIEGGADLNKLLEQFPKVILAVLGMGGDLDVTTLPGYYGVMMYYVYIIGILYAVSLGSGAVNRELIDRTYEFLFVKPRTRTLILIQKLGTNLSFLVVFCLLNVPFSFLGLKIAKADTADLSFVWRFTWSLVFVSLVFFGLGMFWSALLKRPERGATAANLCFFIGFLSGILFDMFDQAAPLKMIAPLRFFEPGEVAAGSLDSLAAGLCVAVTLLLLSLGFRFFEKRDLSET